MGEQGHHEHHGLCRGAQAIEDRTSAGAEGFVALVTDESLLLPRMDTNVAMASLASGRAVLIGAEYDCGVHDGPPGCVWKHAKRSMSGPPFLLQVSFTTVKWRATIFGFCLEKAILRQSPHVHLRMAHQVNRFMGCDYNIEGFWRVMKDTIGAGRCFPALHQLYQRTRQVLMAHQERPIYAFHW